MKKLISPLFWIAIFVTAVLMLGHVISVSAQAQDSDEYSAQQRYLLDKTDGLSLTFSNTYTTYLPIVIAPPPPSSKKGVGIIASPACADVQTLKASWYLNWSVEPDPTCELDDSAKFVPRIYSADSLTLLSQAIAHAQASGWLIGFSEPNLPWQGATSPTEGAIAWRQIEQAADAASIKLVSPSPNQWEPGQADPYGHQWTWAMVSAYKAMYGKKPRFDAIGWNIYKRTPGEVEAYLTTRHNEALTRGYDVPIWVLEYGGECWNSASGNTGNQSIMTATTAWFEATPWVQRYAWFANRLSGTDGQAMGWQSCSLINTSTGQLTSLGFLYQGF